jgi:hypothetical protein
MLTFQRPLQQLLGRPAVQQFSFEMIGGVLQTAFSTNGWTSLEWMLPQLCQLPQAHQLQLNSILAWLQTTLAKRKKQEAAVLFSWLERNTADPSVSLSSSAAEELMQSVLPTTTGGYLSGLEAVCSLQSVRRAADASIVVRMMDRAFAYEGVQACSDPAAAAKLLLQLPAAAEVPAAELARLMARMVGHCTDDLLTDDLLQQLQEIGSLPGQNELLQLISVCLQERTDVSAAACIQLLCFDQASQHVRCSTVLQVLLDAIKLQQPHAVLALLQGLPAAAQLSSRQVDELLQTTVSAALQQQQHSIAAFGGRQALSSFEADSIEQSAAACKAVAQVWSAAVQAVVSMPVAHKIKADSVLKLLMQAVNQDAADTVQPLASIESLQQLDSKQVELLLQPAWQRQQYGCLHGLLQLPGYLLNFIRRINKHLVWCIYCNAFKAFSPDVRPADRPGVAWASLSVTCLCHVCSMSQMCWVL